MRGGSPGANRTDFSTRATHEEIRVVFLSTTWGYAAPSTTCVSTEVTESQFTNLAQFTSNALRGMPATAKRRAALMSVRSRLLPTTIPCRLLRVRETQTRNDRFRQPRRLQRNPPDTERLPRSSVPPRFESARRPGREPIASLSTSDAGAAGRDNRTPRTSGGCPLDS